MKSLPCCSMRPFLDSVTRRLFQPAGTALLAVSGGADSMALLDLMLEAGPDLGLSLIVGHVDHGIRPESARVADLVMARSKSLGVEACVGRVALGPAASETKARAARYRWLRALQAEVGARYLVTAHHFDDQIETVLLRVLEGSGPAGLAGMPLRGARGLRRPLLPFRRAALRAYVEARQIPFDDDPANVDPRHVRSWVRVALLPLLRERLPDADEGLARVATQAARDRQAWDHALDQLQGLDPRRLHRGVEVARQPLHGYDKVLSVAVLRALARRAGFVLSERAARRALRIAAAASGRRAELGGNWVAEAAFDRLRLVHEGDPLPVPRRIEAMPGSLDWNGEWRLKWGKAEAPASLERVAWVTWVPDGTPLVWRGPEPGDRIRPLGGVGHRSVGRLLMEARVPARARRRYPLLASGGGVLWIPGVCRAETAVPAPGSPAVRVDVTSQRVSPPDRWS